MRKSARVGLATDQVQYWWSIVGRAAFYMLFIVTETRNRKSAVADKRINNIIIQTIRKRSSQLHNIYKKKGRAVVCVIFATVI